MNINLNFVCVPFGLKLCLERKILGEYTLTVNKIIFTFRENLGKLESRSPCDVVFLKVRILATHLILDIIIRVPCAAPRRDVKRKRKFPKGLEFVRLFKRVLQIQLSNYNGFMAILSEEA